MHILPTFGEKQINDISPVECQNLVNNWFEVGYVKYKAFLNQTSRIFDYGKRMMLCDDNPMERIIRPVNHDRPKRTMSDNFYDLDELKHFFECLYDDDQPLAYVFFRVLAFSGIRKGEALALTWSDIEFDKKSISINKTLTRGDKARLMIDDTKTYTSRRTVSIDQKTLTILKKWQFEQRHDMFMLGFNTAQPDQLVFANDSNEWFQPSKPRVWLEHVISKYDLKHITVHGFRRTFACLSFEAGLSIKEVQTQMGHKNFQITMDIYTTVTKKKRSQLGGKYAKYVNF